MTTPSQSALRVIATYGDTWFETTYRILAGAIGALPQQCPPVLADYGPMPLVPEMSADAPPWRGKVDGALVCGSTTGDVKAFAAWLRRGGVPTVAMVSDLTGLRVPTVCMDHRELGRVAAQHLVVECGCRSFVHVGSRGSMATRRREQGFRDALALHGRRMRACRVNSQDIAETRTPWPSDDTCLNELLRRLPKPIGLFATSDKLAAASVLDCHRLGLRVPQDVAVLGVKNSVLAHTHSPSLSSIRVREAEMGAAAMRLLVDLMKGGASPREPVLIGGCTLYARMSTVGPRVQGSVLTVDLAMKRIQADACSGLTVYGLADSLGIPCGTLEELFRAERDTTVNEEIERVRFEAAARGGGYPHFSGGRG